MTRTASILAAIATLSTAAPAFAFADEAQGARQTTRPTAQRVVMMCSADAATERSFRRVHGARPVFVTADQVLAARAAGQRWSTPRCMDAREHGRLVQMMSSRASL